MCSDARGNECTAAVALTGPAIINAGLGWDFASCLGGMAKGREGKEEGTSGRDAAGTLAGCAARSV
ncbi:hypothetical protein HYPSUDRAFT_238886 [Hypholoma sublateritium FD-334 SS-4]|uniref:Uncharacterized protein n=1 Tax=Hypholoma sublateritium (strain FD-334 SS-4) TaxID=945553 RepID=A0A0D2PNP3_HYPSF|nr:hypothetical protein HYPSUDRAFT_238886 [Hypholoma sublateritium FD-334 SS-4]